MWANPLELPLSSLAILMSLTSPIVSNKALKSSSVASNFKFPQKSVSDPSASGFDTAGLAAAGFWFEKLIFKSLPSRLPPSVTHF